jgi:aspartyl-tRNA(Asn)/glutamyl-tRNA(Gln) amidotransferase subunit A
VRNPWDETKIPGGSSGGSAVAVATGEAFATLGSDTGGSIRIPASECGCVGLMPTYGRASLYGAVPLSTTLDHPGPLTRTVRDAAIVMQAISGRDPLDHATEDVPVPDMLEGIERGTKSLRIGVPKQHVWEKTSREVEQLVRAAITALEAAGASVREVDAPLLGRYSSQVGPIILSEAAAYHAPNYPARKDEYSRQVGGLLAAASGISAVVYIEAMRVLDAARRGEADAMLEGVDVLAFPTMPEPPPRIGESPIDERAIQRTVNTSLWDLTGQPVISIPCGLLSNTNLPAGISFAGRRWDEASVLWSARAYEQVRGPFPVPPLA